jgi:hypothetical protein
MMTKIGTTIRATAIAAVIGFGITIGQYSDLPMPFTKGTEIGRTKNAIATVVAGIVGQEMYDGNSKIDLTIGKQYWPDAKVTGSTTSGGIDTKVDLTFTSARFKADGNAKKTLWGTVSKSEYDWDVQQNGPNSYAIVRLGPKFNSCLKIDQVKNGVIKGTYERTWAFDWDITGTYDKSGNVRMEIDAPLTMAITLEGKITQK